MSDHTSDEYEHGFAVGVRTGVELEHILQDLISELRRIHQRQDGQSEADNHCWECGCIGECNPATTTATPCWPCATTLAADRAEARLREVQGE